jgi:hypothetical protein
MRIQSAKGDKMRRFLILGDFIRMTSRTVLLVLLGALLLAGLALSIH